MNINIEKVRKNLYIYKKLMLSKYKQLRWNTICRLVKLLKF